MTGGANTHMRSHTHTHTSFGWNHYVHSRCQCVWLSNIGHDFGGEISCCCCVAHCQLAAASDRDKCAVFSHCVYPAKEGANIQPHSASLIGTENWFNVFSCYPPTVWGPTAAVAAASRQSQMLTLLMMRLGSGWEGGCSCPAGWRCRVADTKADFSAQ